jgi:CheY-like chemotaxis protein
MKSRSVLLIEDNLMNMELATDLLEAASFQVLKAERAEDGIALAVAQQPDIILMDIALPGMDGLEATRRIKQDARTAWIPIVALTASAMRGDDDVLGQDGRAAPRDRSRVPLVSEPPARLAMRV